MRATRLRGSLAALVGTAALVCMGIAFAQNANASPLADLTSTMTGPQHVAKGAPITWTITVHNNGPDTTDWAISSGTNSLDNQTEDSPYCTIAAPPLSPALVCDGSALAPGQTRVIHLSGTAHDIDYVAEDFVIVVPHAKTGGTYDPDQSNNQSSVSTVVGDPEPPPPALSGDWGTSGSDLMAPGTSRYYDDTFTCLSAGGCDYAPGLTITDHATNGGEFGAGTDTVYLNGQTAIGTCQVTSNDVSCAVAATGHANQGDTIGARDISYAVADDAAPDVQVFAQTLSVPSGWTGDDPSNNVFPISTPPVAGAPMANWTVGGGIGVMALLLAGGYALRRRTLARAAA